MMEKETTWQRWVKGMGKMKEEVKEHFSQLWSKKETGEKDWEELEELLIQADMGPALSLEIVEEFREFKKSRGGDDWQEWLYQKLFSLLEGNDPSLFASAKEGELKAIILSGVNGVGKTTAAGKLAYLFRNKGEKVSLIAADTFRAAAMEQLEVWAQRAKCRYFRGTEGADPGAVVFNGITSARHQGDTLVIIDTAGRSHVNKNLLAELEKVVRVTKKLILPSNLESILVIDALAGQNAFLQAQSLFPVADLSGIILTKWDSQAKGGIVFRIGKEFRLPVKYLGVGEGIEDLVPFDAEEFVKTIVY
ncbi:signal recognition particle-docking protein FtsY [Candidatus Sordicultor fermentans]|uniref:signal recognition particle-docking protein FtsY n=1 Tax=Candidatus Sordicultor fermentans TaxID=1953203 RepID=UPI003908A7B9